MNTKQTVEVETSQYEHAHGKRPGGRGSWAFHPNFHVKSDDSSIIWVNGLYSVAKREAKAIATARGWYLLFVLS